MASQSVLHGILIELQAQIVALALNGIADANVVLCSAPAVEIANFPATQYPCVVIAPYGSEAVAPSTNRRDDVSYPILVAVCDSLRNDNATTGSKQADHLDKRLFWREALRAAFSNQRLTSTAGMKIDVQPGSIIDQGAFSRGLFVSALLLRVTQRENRT